MRNTGSHRGVDRGGLTAYDGVESVDRISGVLNNTTCAVRFHQVVNTLYVGPISTLLMTLGVSGKSVLDFVSKTVPGVGVVVGIDGGARGHDAYKTGSGESRNSCLRNHTIGVLSVT